MIIEVLIFLLTSLISLIIYNHKKIHSHYDKYGVKYLNGVPLFGNMLKSMFQKKHIIEDFDEVYKAFPDEKYVGFIDGTKRTILIRDPDLIKNITVKDFDHFVNHKNFFPEELEPLFGGSVIMMQNDRWRDMRTTLSPAFTGSKMRQMVPFMTKISQNIIEYLKDNLSDEDIDMGDISRRYTNDVIASTGFGLEINSLKDKNNEFFKIGQTINKFTTLQGIKFFFASQGHIFVKIFEKLGLTLFPKSTSEFFIDVITKNIEYREKNDVERPDMIQLLIQASKGTLKKTTSPTEKDEVGFATVQEELKPIGTDRNWSQNELIGQVFIFFLAGFETSAAALTMCIHELAVNPDVQEKLYQEIINFKRTHGAVTYDNVNELKYLDCVFNETSRKWAAALFMDRVCTKPYQLPPQREGGKPYPLKPGDLVYNMVNCLHLDPQYYPNPTKFDPDRFSDENKHNIRPFTFMPFGMGPRNCIASRFAILEVKVLLFDFLLNFKILKGPKTSYPIEMSSLSFSISAVGGTWVKLEART